jgi:membrane protease YdiL (CAAX protease family)
MIPPEAPALEPPQPRRDEAFWDYQDLFVWFGLLVATFFFVAVSFSHAHNAYLALLVQAVLYGVGLGSIAAILRLRYDRPFWRSLARVGPRPLSALMSFMLGPFVWFSVAYLALLIRAQPKPLPFEKDLSGPALAILYGALVVLVGPLFEELVFRGFMMPLFIRSSGATAGILITAALFGALHIFQYADWRTGLLLSGAGAAFGWRRYTTGSTIDSVLMHVGFNLTPFVALLHRAAYN